MKRPTIILILVVIHVLLIASYMFGAWMLWGIAHEAASHKGPDAAEEVRGLMMGFWACVTFGLLTAIEVWALWKKKAWSRWAGLVFYGLGAIAVTVGIATDSNFEMDDLVAPVTCVILFILFALPSLRRALEIRNA